MEKEKKIEKLIKDIELTIKIVEPLEKIEEKLYRQKLQELKEIVESSENSLGFSFGFQAGYLCACREFLDDILDLKE